MDQSIEKQINAILNSSTREELVTFTLNVLINIDLCCNDIKGLLMTVRLPDGCRDVVEAGQQPAIFALMCKTKNQIFSSTPH